MSKEQLPYKHIVVAGNIGAGKTSLCRLLGEEFGWTVNYESTDDNPYLEDFYNDMGRWSFNLQVYFLNSRYRQVLKIKAGNEVVIQDRSLYEDAHIFAANLHEMDLMSVRDFKNYFDLFLLMESQITPPDLMIYLKSSVPTLVKHIQKRGRSYESNMSLHYLQSLNERYENWIAEYSAGKLLTLSADQLDYVGNEEDRKKVIAQVKAALDG
ncbi:deoxynucleoside kinase [Saprospira grandis]|uniref:Deoxynucleoside kinase subfamily protein n=1 Tax=Saprospira grandis (strain Lewin) TaxID=984262 RepID=H6L885_SAPGL|nr:deoxynucleoside kinase [Saprospira grandis]AFC26449.1 deoxynucleoside kinase subfamily protein [Saprospira grandis str. Lewin]